MNHLNKSNSTYSTDIPADCQAATAICGLCFLLGISGNIAVVVFLLRHFKRDNFTLKLMLNLAVSDILSLLTLPVWMSSFLFGWTMGHGFCKFIYFVTHTGIYASAFTVTLMSVHRYVLVLHRLMWNKLGQRGERGILMGVWVLAGVIAAAPITTFVVLKDGNTLNCEQVARSEGEKVAVLLSEIMLVYFLSLIILMTSYICLQRKVTARTLNNYKLAPLVTAIIVTFFIFTTPYAVVSIMIMATPSKPLGPVMKLAYTGPRIATQSIVFLITCVNPLLYAFNFRSLRQSADKNVPEPSINA